jgi:hypothetical protein
LRNVPTIRLDQISAECHEKVASFGVGWLGGIARRHFSFRHPIKQPAPALEYLPIGKVLGVQSKPHAAFGSSASWQSRQCFERNAYIWAAETEPTEAVAAKKITTRDKIFMAQDNRAGVEAQKIKSGGPSTSHTRQTVAA